VPRIVLADDREEMRRELKVMLEREFQIVGLAQNGKEVIELVLAQFPDVLILDIVMPILNGIETAQQLKASGCQTAVVMLSLHADHDFLDAAMSVGALGYVHKPHITTDLVPAIRTVLLGHCYVSPSMQSW
jgi:DNA-binding NarL/FixJ family response regulator